MPISLVLSDESIDALASAIAAKLGQPALTPESVPAATDDSPAPAKGGKKGSKAAAQEAPPETPAEEEAAPTTDLVTEEQLAKVDDASKETDLDTVREQLQDFYIAQGSSKKEIQTVIAGMSEDDLRYAYKDFLARLLVEDTDDFCTDYETPYLAIRVNEGVEEKVWVKGGVTLSADDVKAADLPDPNKPKAPEKKKGPALPKRGK